MTRARYYSPEIMRFISEDTFKGSIDNPLTLNYYAYCWGNPVMLYDPSGNWPNLLKLARGLMKGIGGALTVGVALAAIAACGVAQTFFGSVETIEGLTGYNGIKQWREGAYQIADMATGAFVGDIYILEMF